MPLQIVSRLLVSARRNKRRCIRTMFVLFGAAGLTISGQTLPAQQWIQDSDGSWHDPANWEGGIVPNSQTADAWSNRANIITLDSAAQIRSLLLDNSAVVNHTAGILAIAPSGSITSTNGSYNLDGGIISGGTIMAGSNIQFNSGGIDNVEFQVSGSYDHFGNVQVTGTTVFSNHGGTFTNSNLLTMTGGADSSLNIASGFVNQGSLVATSGSSIFLSGNWDNTNEMTAINGGKLILQGTTPSPMAGSISVHSSSHLAIKQDLTTVGQINLGNSVSSGIASVDSGMTLTISNPGSLTLEYSYLDIYANGNVVNDGAVYATGNTEINGAGTFTNNTSLDVASNGSDGSLTIRTDFINSSTASLNVGGATLNVDGSWINEGRINAANQATITVLGGANRGVLNIENGSQIILQDGQTTFASTSELIGDGLLMNNGLDSVELNGRINPGDTNLFARLNFEGNFRLGSNAETLIELGDPSGTYDSINADGAFELGGLLRLNFSFPFALTDGLQWNILTSNNGALRGSFSGLSENVDGFDFLLDYDANGNYVTVTSITAVPEPSSIAMLGVAAIVVSGYRRFKRVRKK